MTVSKIQENTYATVKQSFIKEGQEALQEIVGQRVQILSVVEDGQVMTGLVTLTTGHSFNVFNIEDLEYVGECEDTSSTPPTDSVN